MAKKSNGAVRRKINEFTEMLQCTLTPTEREARQKQVLKLLRDKGRLEEEKKQAASHFKSKIEKVQAEISAAMIAAERGTEDRQVQVEEWVLPSGVVERIRLDTLEVIRTRKSSASEAQDELPGTDAPADADAWTEGA